MQAKSLKVIAEISERYCGGWIAVSGRGSPLSIGVTADTEEEARAAFDEAVIQWEAILNTPSQADLRCQ